MPGMGVRPTYSHTALSLAQQIIPDLDRLWQWTVRDGLRPKCIVNCIQLSFCNRFEFTEAIPQFDAGKAGYTPVFPGDIRFSKSRHGWIHRVGDKG